MIARKKHPNYRRWPEGYVPRSVTVKLRVTPDENYALALTAAAKGYRSVSAYLRALIAQDALH